MPLEQHLEIRRQRLEAIRLALEPVLARTRTFTWEVGSGHGHFLTAYAEAHPHETCVGIDLLTDRLERAEKKSHRARLDNLFWIRADASLFLEVLPPDVVIPRTWVLFPDPWPKKRHWKNRLLQPEFLDALARHAPAGGQLCFRTDHAPYFAHGRGPRRLALRNSHGFSATGRRLSVFGCPTLRHRGKSLVRRHFRG
jgi:tRNA (guanine-N7-)-methyltransferase